VLEADRFWILPNGFTVQRRVTPWSMRAASIPPGSELLPFTWRRLRRTLRRQAARTQARRRDARETVSV
jgi:hypothetical protein